MQKLHNHFYYKCCNFIQLQLCTMIVLNIFDENQLKSVK